MGSSNFVGMNKKFRFSDQIKIASQLIRLTVMVVQISVTTGSLVALLLWSPNEVTILRWHHEWLIFLLSIASAAIHFLYKLWGKNSEGGNNLISLS